MMKKDYIKKIMERDAEVTARNEAYFRKVSNREYDDYDIIENGVMVEGDLWYCISEGRFRVVSKLGIGTDVKNQCMVLRKRECDLEFDLVGSF